MNGTMVLDPKGPWVQVELSFDKKKDGSPYTIALPDDYRPQEKPYKAVSVVKDPEGEYSYGDVIILPTHVLREIELVDSVFHLVERNHVMAVVRSE